MSGQLMTDWALMTWGLRTSFGVQGMYAGIQIESSHISQTLYRALAAFQRLVYAGLNINIEGSCMMNQHSVLTLPSNR